MYTMDCISMNSGMQLFIHVLTSMTENHECTYLSIPQFSESILVRGVAEVESSYYIYICNHSIDTTYTLSFSDSFDYC